MKILVIGHPEAVLGFSLVGVHGQTATSAEEAHQALDSALASPDVGIILVTEDIARRRISRLLAKLCSG
jgi:vacuolar-type H+-ATPase subunit F/Vma7